MRSTQQFGGVDRSLQRAWIKGAGFIDEELEQPLVLIANTYQDFSPENAHLRQVVDAVKAGVRMAGGTPMEFNTFHVTDSEAFAARSMRYVLPSRDVVADSVELMAEGHGVDGLVLLTGGDKPTPGMVMAAARLDLPAILLYAGVHRQALARGQVQDKLAPTGAFAAGYLVLWLGFSVVAAALHWALERVGLVSAMMMGSKSRWLSAGVLIAAGLYQLSPLKHRCLAHCRAPASFLSRHWRPHGSGAFLLGVLHGLYCVGCCWMLMALLFVGGVMNLAWIAALAALVLMEKVLPAGQWIRRATGIVLLAWGALTLTV